MSWYDGVSVHSKNFERLASASSSLQLSVFSKKLSLRSIKDSNVLAYADKTRQAIVVQESLVTGEHDFFKPFPWSKRLELFNGIVIHEAAHFLLSPGKISDFPTGDLKLTALLATIINVVEDLYIENYVSTHIQKYEYFLHAINNVIFPDSEIVERRSKTNGNKPETKEEVELLVDYTISFKRHEYVFALRSEFERTVYNMFMSSMNLHDYQDRGKLACDIYKFIVPEDVAKKEESKEPEVESNIFSSSTENGEVVRVNVEEIVREVFYIKPYSSDTTHMDVGINYYIHHSRPGSNTLEVKKTSVDMTKLRLLENARGSVRSIVGVPSYSGRKLSHLHRAGGDGRIFGEIKIDGHRAGRGAPEIIFLIDMSGSMRGDVGHYGSGIGMKVDFAMSAAYEFNKAMRNTPTKFAIYGHTTSTFGDFAGVEFIELKRFEEVVCDSEMWDRMKRAKGTIQLSGNADGVALILASSKFTKSHHGDKILFIVSDGKPSVNIAEFYKDKRIPLKCDGAIEATANAAKYLRSSGVKLFSASIDAQAVIPCNLIYGEENNVEVTNVEQLVSMVMRSLN